MADPYTCIVKKNRKYSSECTEAGRLGGGEGVRAGETSRFLVSTGGALYFGSVNQQVHRVFGAVRCWWGSMAVGHRGEDSLKMSPAFL